MRNGEKTDDPRGREAEKPAQIPRKGWWDIAKRVKEEVDNDHVAMIAAGIAFYGLLAIFPAIVALISIWSLVFDPQQITQQIASVGNLLPQQAADIINQQARKASSNAGAGIGLAALGGLLLTLYSASKGTKGLMEGLNIIYDEQEARGLLKRTLVTLLLTLGGMLVAIVALGSILLIPALVKLLGLPEPLATLINLARWLLLLIMLMVSLAILYRYAADRDEPRWQWTSVGAVAGVVLWLLGSIAFSIYVRNFGSYNETYGSLGAVVILLMWFWLSAFIVLLGAELNSEMERQTRRDTTKGKREPLGKRGAHAADTVGEKRS
ncbi:membrane protein [Modicisalibacter ilicicola DSM 19980]|uniref:Membrane protein n=1 Tax=Modicisalibacter ilicicola DSM 19980 TaxID=1121942 RepID=A0A1M5E5F9_9GAMM|nr:YihY/virulence factor BrkB family protein [Halomonas ilicicola]SHF74312.1 membrane protein [Halomonas ilicicola DSM 19980]